jgi:hypothetical protein
MLKNKVHGGDWDTMTEEDYIPYSAYSDPSNTPIGLIFLCPGCKQCISIETPPWRIDFIKLSARDSILHTLPTPEQTAKGITAGCGWHGFLTNGNFTLDCPPCDL